MIFRKKQKAPRRRSIISFVKNWYRPTATSYADQGWGWSEEVGTLAPGGSSGVTVNPYTVLSHPVVWQAVNMIANDVASIPLFKMERQLDKGNTFPQLVRNGNHRVDRIFNRRPNHFQTPFQFKRTVMRDVLLWGNHCSLPVTDRDGQLALHPLPPQSTYIREYDPGSQDFYIQTIYRNRWRTIPYDEVFHVSGLPSAVGETSYSINGIWGYSVTQVLRDALGAGVAMQTHQNSTFAAGGQPSGVIETEQERDPEGHTNLREEWQEVHANPGKIAILWDGMKYNPIPMQSNHDAQLVDLRRLDREYIASVFNLPVYRLNGLEYASGRSNLAEAQKTYLYQTITDWTEPISDECEKKLFTRREQTEQINIPDRERVHKHLMNWNYDDFIREERKVRFDTYAVGIQSRILNPNEARALEEMAPYEGGDEFQNPNVMSGPNGLGGENDQGGMEQGQVPAEQGEAEALWQRNGHDALRN